MTGQSDRFNAPSSEIDFVKFMAAQLKCPPPDRAVVARNIVLCSWARHCILTVPAPRWIKQNLNSPSRFILLKPEIDAVLIGHLARMQTFFTLIDIKKLTLVFGWLYKARCSELLESLKAPLSREQEEKAPSISRNTTCRKTFGWWTPEDFLTLMKIFWMSASTSCLEGKL